MCLWRCLRHVEIVHLFRWPPHPVFHRLAKARQASDYVGVLGWLHFFERLAECPPEASIGHSGTVPPGTPGKCHALSCFGAYLLTDAGRCPHSQQQGGHGL